LHAIVLGRRIIVSCEADTSPDLATAIHTVALAVPSMAASITDCFSRIYFMGKSLRACICFHSITHLPFTPIHFLDYFEMLYTLDLQTIPGNYVLQNYWRLLFEVVFHCIPSLTACDDAKKSFLRRFFCISRDVCQNRAFTLERRAIPLWAFASLWGSWSHNDTVKQLCVSFLVYEVQLCMDTLASEERFADTPITSILNKCSLILDPVQFIQSVFNIFHRLYDANPQPVSIATACLYYGDLFEIVPNMPISDTEAIFDQLRSFLGQLTIAFVPLIAHGVLYLIQRLPAEVWSANVDQFFAFLIDCAQYPDWEMKELTLSVFTNSVQHLKTKHLIQLCEGRSEMVDLGLYWAAMFMLFQRDEILPIGLIEDVITNVHVYLRTENFLFLAYALAIIARYLDHRPDQLAQHLDALVDFMITRIM
jgi:hypothetical protein